MRPKLSLVVWSLGHSHVLSRAQHFSYLFMLFQLLSETPPSPEQPKPPQIVMMAESTESTETECTHSATPAAKNIAIQV